MSKEERYAEHTVAWELPNGDSVTKSNYNLAGIETKYTPIQTEVISADKDKQIADLEAKLAEHNEYFRSFSCENFNEFQDFISTFMLTPHEEQTLIRELKQQLAEKDKEIEKILKENERLCVKYNVYTYGDKIERDKIYAVSGEALEFLINNQNQKAIEQLEKVKNIILNERKITSFKFDTFNKGKDTALFWLNEQINQQINELKGEQK